MVAIIYEIANTHFDKKNNDQLNFNQIKYLKKQKITLNSTVHQ